MPYRDTSNQIGVWLIQLGTPDDPSTSSVRRYLNEFLMDRRMIDLPYPLRLLLVRGIITLFRAPKSAHAYQSVWMKEGGPLKVYTERLAKKVQASLPAHYHVEVGMRYGTPSIEESWKRFKKISPEKIIVLPLFPQYASSSSGSAMEKIFEVVQGEINIPHLQFIPPFYAEENFISSFAQIAEETKVHEFDHVLFSYHGLPEKYVKESGIGCLQNPNCCDVITEKNNFCYRAHCVQTTKLLKQKLGLPDSKVSIGFQSRLGPAAWIQPFADQVIVELAEKGVKKLAVFCPSFVADCLETLEEIQIRAAEDFIKAGGKELKLIPSLNDHPTWVDSITRWILNFDPNKA